MANFIEARKAEGKKLYLLSNTNGIHVPFFESTYPIFALFDGRMYSHEVGRMKPDAAIYEIAQKRFSLIPERTLYIDDLHANCVAGREAGYLTVQYSPAHHEDFLKALTAMGED